MDISTSTIDPGVFTLGTVFFALLGLLVWWLKRKRRRRLWLPTLRVLKLETNKLPRIRLTVPPFVAFLCFLLCTLALGIFTLRPSKKVYTPFDPTQNRVHLYLDLSPSVSATISIENYRNLVEEVYESISERSRITISHSGNHELVEPNSKDDLRRWLNLIEFHRPGVKLGASIKELTSRMGEVDRFIIISDGDRYSWEGFNWKFLNEEMDVKLVRTSKQDVFQNVYIREVRFQSLPSDKVLEWDIEIAKSGPPAAKSGILTVTYMGEVIKNLPWSLSEDQDAASLRVSWPANRFSSAGKKADHVLWKITTKSEDHLKMDNEFRTVLDQPRSDFGSVGECHACQFQCHRRLNIHHDPRCQRPGNVDVIPRTNARK